VGSTKPLVLWKATQSLPHASGRLLAPLSRDGMPTVACIIRLSLKSGFSANRLRPLIRICQGRSERLLTTDKLTRFCGVIGLLAARLRQGCGSPSHPITNDWRCLLVAIYCFRLWLSPGWLSYVGFRTFLRRISS
jgi:hypothetical protein